MSEKLDINFVKEYLWDNFKYKLISEYKNIIKPFDIITIDGYYIKVRMSSLKRGYVPSIISGSNPHSIYNIKLWCKLNNKPFELISDKYINTNIKLKWKCLKKDCQENFETSWSQIFNRNHGCPYCSGHQVVLSNCLATKNPELAKEWHPTKNGDLTPYNVTCGSNKRVWWICEKGHEWESRIYVRTDNKYNTTCPICTNKQVLKGYNDMWTTNPKLANLLANPEDGYKYTQGSSHKVDWKCPRCNNIIKNKVISNMLNHRLFCPKCSDGLSYPEKFIYNILNQLNIEYEYQKCNFSWAKGKIYDFYLNSLNVIIEIHGKQHYMETFSKMGGRTLKEEQDNDKYKRQLAIDNNINNYIIIDAKKSELEYIKYNIINSELKELLNLSKVNWMECHEFTCNSFVKIACDLWNNEIKDTTEIGNKMRLCRKTIVTYLKRGTMANICDYDSKVCTEITRNKISKTLRERHIEENLNNIHINEITIS